MTLVTDPGCPTVQRRSLRVVIADDHPFYRAGLARMLERNEFDVVAEVPNGAATIREVERLRPDVVVVDLNMAGTTGLAAIRRIAERAHSTPVIVLSVSADEQDVADAILAGASGYLLKDRPYAEIVMGIRAAAAGQAPLSPRIAAMLIRRLRTSDPPPDDDEIRRAIARHLRRPRRSGLPWRW